VKMQGKAAETQRASKPESPSKSENTQLKAKLAPGGSISLVRQARTAQHKPEARAEGEPKSRQINGAKITPNAGTSTIVCPGRGLLHYHTASISL